ncbi:hypothetical protein [[Erwinia] mediterraneensis]|uniref:hypothetical protein n=1 Tax=[Erwinia] mediterraneensis TaxID=2161819 RepID=UPI001F1A3D50|nr:hypothetical protein [[Erwinia] mediterraneensis]
MTTMLRNLIIVLGCLVSGNLWAQQAQPALFQPKAAVPFFTPAAAKCDVSTCQANCYVARSHCNNKEGGGCSSEAQMCVQACADQCR